MPNRRLLSFSLALAALALVSGCPSGTAPTPSPEPSGSATPEVSPTPSPAATPTPSPEPMESPTPMASPSASPEPSPSPSPASQENATVSIKDGVLTPENVVVAANGAVTWLNDESEESDVMHALVPVEIGDFRGTGNIDPGRESAPRQFNGPGIKKYFCSIHPEEKGTITVLAPN